MKYSGIGGQAVMEGVMMKNQDKYAVAVRKPDYEIVVEVSEYNGLLSNKKIRNMPIFRGVFSFIESLTLGMRALTFSASFYEDEEDEKPEKEQKKDEKKQNIILKIIAVLFGKKNNSAYHFLWLLGLFGGISTVIYASFV